MKKKHRIACYDCRFFSPGEFGCSNDMSDEVLGDFEDDNKGECRRYPLHYRYGGKISLPSGDEYLDSADWPKVNASDWCGEFKPRNGHHCPDGCQCKSSCNPKIKDLCKNLRAENN